MHFEWQSESERQVKLLNQPRSIKIGNTGFEKDKRKKCWYNNVTEKFILFEQEFSQIGVIATGRFGKVVFVEQEEYNSVRNQQCYALKIMQKRKIVHKGQIKHVMNERQILSAVNHPFIVKAIATFTDDIYCYILMELVTGGDIFSILNKMNKFEESRASFYSAQICIALEYLHDMSIAYRDLKPENVLIGTDGYIKLGDFGFARYCLKGDKMLTICGTVGYGAPEILTKSGYGLSVDWWALGILIYEMCHGKLPFEGNNVFNTQQLVIKSTYTTPEQFSNELKDLLKFLIQKDTTVRYQHGSNIILGGILKHAWFNKWNKDTLLLKQYNHQWQAMEHIKYALDKDEYYDNSSYCDGNSTFNEEFQDFSD